MRDDLENHFQDRPFRSEQWLSTFRLLQDSSQDSTKLVRKSCQECSSDTHCGEIWKGDMLVADIEWGKWTRRKSTLEGSMKGNKNV